MDQKNDPLSLCMAWWDGIPTLEEAALPRAEGRLNPPPPKPEFTYSPLSPELQDAAEEITRDLRQCIGSEKFFQNGFDRTFLHTEGIEQLAEQAECHWLIDIVGSWQHEAKVKREDFQVWYVLVANAPPPGPGPWPGPGEDIDECSDTYCWVWMEDGHETNRSVKVVQFVPYTGLILGRWPHRGPAANPLFLSHQERNTHHRCALRLYAERNSRGGVTLMLPSER